MCKTARYRRVVRLVVRAFRCSFGKVVGVSSLQMQKVSALSLLQKQTEPRGKKKKSDVIPAMGNDHRTEAYSGLQSCLHDLMSGRSTLSLQSLASIMRML